MFGIGIAFFVQGDIGVPPWDVFHQGVSGKTGYAIGTVIVFSLIMAARSLNQRIGARP